MNTAAPTLVAADAPLFRPGQIGRMTLRNHFLQAPIFTQFTSTRAETGEWRPAATYGPTQQDS